MPPSLERLTCLSWLIYATKSEDEQARRIKNLILQVKTDRIDPQTGVPVVQLVVRRAVERLGIEFLSGFEGDPVLVPVPRSGLTKPRTVWPAQRVCEELVRAGLGVDTLPLIRRTTAVDKSAGAASRPPLATHAESLAVQPNLRPPSRVILVDDVVTSGTTMFACAAKLAATYPGVPVNGFALARVLSAGDPGEVFHPLIETIVQDGARCRRG